MSISEKARAQFETRGWIALGPSEDVLAWAEAARPLALAAARASPDRRCGGTWGPGVDGLDNAVDGSVGGVPFPESLAAVLRGLGLLPDRWHRAQLSAVYPGYPRRGPEESAAAARFRRTRDAAHLDGLLPVGPQRRRMPREAHGFILGLPVTHADPGASPLVVWEGSHRDLQAALAGALRSVPPERLPETDVTELYHQTRRRIFETRCRVPLPCAPGEAVLVHRHILHGVAPWAQGSQADPNGRIIAYFRPELPGGLRDWIAFA